MSKIRLDSYLYQNGFFDSREKAKKSVMAGDILIDSIPATKPGKQIDQNFPKEKIQVKKPLYPYVSRGGLKLEKGLKVFEFPVDGLNFMDIGASTGGFTDVLLQNGAAKVYSIDVGYGQLDYKLREDPRVKVLERTNFRYLEPEKIPDQIDGSVMDVSFISITKLLEKIKELTKENALGIWLIKPQFEAGREKVGKGGVVRSPKVHQEVLENTVQAVQNQGFTVLGLDISPIKGPNGNKEFLIFTQNKTPEEIQLFNERIEELINKDE